MMAGRGELADKAWGQRREVNRAAAQAHQRAAIFRPRPREANAKSGPLAHPTRHPTGETSEASSNTRQYAVPDPAELSTLNRYFEDAPPAKILEWVHEYIARRGVPVNPLLRKGYKSIGCEPQTRPVAPDEDRRAGRWSGLEKTECGLHWAEGR